MASARPANLSPNTPLSYTPFSIFSRFSDSADPLADSKSHQSTPPKTLTQAVTAQRKRYRRPTRITIQVATWNVGNNTGAEEELSKWLDVQGDVLDQLPAPAPSADQSPPRSAGRRDAPATEDGTKGRAEGDKETPKDPKGDKNGTANSDRRVHLYVLGLQEVVDINSPTAVMRLDPTAISRWRAAATKALPTDVQLVLDVQLMGMLLLIYAVDELADRISSANATSVGTGVMGYLGNKGAVAVRLLIGETTRLVFINSHLAAGSEKSNMERRNWDVGQIVARVRFPPVVDAGVEDDFEGQIGDEDYAWWFGDLNYRLQNMPGEDIRHLLALHMPKEEELRKAAKSPTSPFRPSKDRSMSWSRSLNDPDSASLSDADTFSSTASTIVGHEESGVQSTDADGNHDFDPISPHPGTIQSTIDSLLPHDELRAQQKAKQVLFDGWREGHIGFLPTYKYDIGSITVFDSSEKKRAPSWCDRILYRSKKDRVEYEHRVKDEEESRRFEESVKSQNPDDVLYDYHPESDSVKPEEFHYDDESLPSAIPPQMSPGGEHEPDLRLLSYTSHQQIVSSDHKPVTAIFELQYDEVVPDLKVQVFNEAARDFDRNENEDRPTVTIVVDTPAGTEASPDAASAPTLSPAGSPDRAQNVDFGEVRFNQYVRRDITIANTGRVPSSVSFAQKQESSPSGTPRICKPWLKVNCIIPNNVVIHEDGPEPQSRDTDEIVLEPGEALNVVLELVVDGLDLLKSLNDHQEELHDVLVLHVSGGRDHFLTISATWMASCFGRTIDELVRVPDGGVRSLPSPSPKTKSEDSQADETTPNAVKQVVSLMLAENPVRWAAPKELYKLTEEIEDLTERAVADWEMKAKVFNESPPWLNELAWPFRPATEGLHSRNHDLALGIREALDNGKPLKSAFESDVSVVQRLEALADTLLDFLTSLRDGIVTEPLWWDMEVEHSKRMKAKLEVEAKVERDFILDNLAQSPNHNICFVFICSMLEKISGELADSGERVPPSASPSTKALQRLKPGSSSPEKPSTIRRSIDRKFAEIFSEVIFRSGQGKERKRAADRRIRILEVFLQKWEDQG